MGCLRLRLSCLRLRLSGLRNLLSLLFCIALTTSYNSAWTDYYVSLSIACYLSCLFINSIGRLVSLTFSFR